MDDAIKRYLEARENSKIARDKVHKYRDFLKESVDRLFSTRGGSSFLNASVPVIESGPNDAYYVTVDALEWPTADEIQLALLARHEASNAVMSTWDAIDPEMRRLLDKSFHPSGSG